MSKPITPFLARGVVKDAPTDVRLLLWAEGDGDQKFEAGEIVIGATTVDKNGQFEMVGTTDQRNMAEAEDLKVVARYYDFARDAWLTFEVPVFHLQLGPEMKQADATAHAQKMIFMGDKPL